MAETNTDDQCIAITKWKTRCNNKKKYGDYCSLHYINLLVKKEEHEHHTNCPLNNEGYKNSFVYDEASPFNYDKREWLSDEQKLILKKIKENGTRR